MVELDREDVIRRCKALRDRKRELQKLAEREWEEKQKRKLEEMLDAMADANTRRTIKCTDFGNYLRKVRTENNKTA